MDPDAMTTLLGDHIYNIEEEEEYWEACQHTLESPYELRANDKDEEGGAMIVVVTAIAVMVDMVMITTAPIVMTTTTEVMIARTAEMIGVNPLVK